MNNSKAVLLILALACFNNPLSAQQIVVRNSTCPGAADACLSSGQVSFGLTDLTLDPADGDPKRRFSAFWVPGDGNFIQFDPSQDALSMSPNYVYSATGNYESSAYLTGKYTNKKPPARAALPVNIGTLGTGTGGHRRGRGSNNQLWLEEAQHAGQVIPTDHHQ